MLSSTLYIALKVLHCLFSLFNSQERAEMIIGTHFLEGKVVKLSKPFLVTQDHKIGSETEFIVLGTAYRKILFSNRPKIRTTL